MAIKTPPVLLVDFENIQDLDQIKKLRNTDIAVRVFLGPQQTRLPTPLVRHAQPFGHRLQWIVMEGHGKNALDFHIAYTVGLLVAEDRSWQIFVLSKDSGFDPLIAYLTKRGIACERIETLVQCLAVNDEPNLKVQEGPNPVSKRPATPMTASETPPAPPDAASPVLLSSKSVPKSMAKPAETFTTVAVTPSTLPPAANRAPSLTEVIDHLKAIPPRTRPKKPKTLAAHLASHFKKQSPGNDFSLVLKALAKQGKISINDDKLSYHTL